MGKTIPALPCESVDEAVAFWQMMGLVQTYRQKAPNAYAVIRHEAEDYDIHLFGLKIKPEDNFSTCLVVVDDVEQLHAYFAKQMREGLGKVPGRGFPRISRMQPRQTRFTLTDVAGNSVIFVKQGGEDNEAAEKYKQSDLTPLQQTIHLAARLRDFKNDDVAAAKALDVALARKYDLKNADVARDYQQALEARIELALAMDDATLAQSLRTKLGAIGD